MITVSVNVSCVYTTSTFIKNRYLYIQPSLDIWVWVMDSQFPTTSQSNVMNKTNHAVSAAAVSVPAVS